MKASYKFRLEQQQRRLGLSHKQLNKLDREYNDVNLIKYLQSLEPKVTAPPPANTGFYGTFTIGNQARGLSDPKWIEIKLEYNNINIVTQTIYSETTEVLTIPIGSRLPLPTSILQLKTRIQGPVGIISGVDITNVSGYTITDITGNDPTDENILSLLVDSDKIDGGDLTLDFIIDTQ
jgi:hypothetical protein